MNRLANAINKMIRRNIPFFIFRLPDEEKVICGCQEYLKVERIGSTDTADCRGFLMSPFKSYDGSADPFFLKAHRWCDSVDAESLEQMCEGLEFDSVPAQQSDRAISVSRIEYINQCASLIKTIREGEIHKAILSRIVACEEADIRMAGELFASLLENYSSAFVFLINIPGVATWAGASPETLLSVSDGRFDTMSLAGTQRWKDGFTSSVDNWSFKDVQEQRLVTDYIDELLIRNNIEYNKSATTVRKAGDIAHLCTCFSGVVDENLSLYNLIKALHPTPAVCGTPKEKALDVIISLESHNRDFYAGYLGPVFNKNKISLFVNLRSTRLLPDKILIYVGGGVTIASDPEKEWVETELKAKTILNVINEWRRKLQTKQTLG